MFEWGLELFEWGLEEFNGLFTLLSFKAGEQALVLQPANVVLYRGHRRPIFFLPRLVDVGRPIGLGQDLSACEGLGELRSAAYSLSAPAFRRSPFRLSRDGYEVVRRRSLRPSSYEVQRSLCAGARCRRTEFAASHQQNPETLATVGGHKPPRTFPDYGAAIPADNFPEKRQAPRPAMDEIRGD
jgi:hypothetical protein